MEIFNDMNDTVYRVLWIDDESFPSFEVLAGYKKIQLDHFSNWEDALPILEKHFNEWTAIVLDANCKLFSRDAGITERFLGTVISSLMRLYGLHHREIPWYILSAGTMNSFDLITDVVVTQERLEREKDWGETVYLKGEQESEIELINNIRRVGDTQSNNIVLYRHKDAFQYLGDDALISDSARKIMLKALAVLYYPEENLNYEFAGNPIRKVVEYLFKAAYKYGLLSDAFFDDRGNLRIWDSMQYLCGMDASSVGFRFGNKGVKKDYSDYESVLPTTCYNSFKGLLNYVNVDSHTLGEEDNSPYKIDAESKDLFFAYVMFLCHIIICFGEYIEQHPNVEENKAKMTALAEKKSTKETKEPKEPKPEVVFIKNETAESFIGKVFPVINMREFPTVGGCKIAKDLRLKVLQRVRIDEVIENTGKDAKEYPFIVTRVTPQE